MGKRSRRRMTYHGRSGHPVIHQAKTTGNKYIMVRKSKGGRKRLYLDKHGNIPKQDR